MQTERGDQEHFGSVPEGTTDLGSLEEKAGSRIGAYKLLQQIGTGGFGVVYMAEQTEPVRRTVALKIIKPGMDTKEVIARFESERQALALMDHPGVARVLDAGATQSGRPYFVMELVKGVPITQFCDTSNLSTEGRLKLMAAVCNAVQHAHHKGIIHRDLKPSNILVALHDDEPAPKVIDFGVAKATNQQLTERTLFTQYGQMIGTPAYVSPEQAEMSGLDIDTRSDIYSLGVVLYELLTGSTPFDSRRLRQAGIAEMQRIIREERPPRPSTRLSTLGDSASAVCMQRGTDPKRLCSLLKGELDWIVMKAMEKERGRRYATPNDLAADIERFLRSEPIAARPPSPAYKLAKFVERNRVAVGATALFAAALVAATTISTGQAIRANREASRARRAEHEATEHLTEANRQRVLADERLREADEQRQLAESSEKKAKKSAAEAKAVSDFLQFDMLYQASPQFQPDRELTMRAVLDRAAQRIGGRFDQQPLVEASLQFIIGHTYAELGLDGQAEAHLRRALELRERELGESDSSTITAMLRLAYLLRNQYRLAEAERLIRRGVDLHVKLNGPNDLQTLVAKNALAFLLHLQGKPVEAETLTRQILEVRLQHLGDRHRQSLDTLNILAKVIQPLGKLEESEMLARQVLERRRDHQGIDHPEMLQAMYDLGGILQLRGKLDEAYSLAREADALVRRVYGEDHRRTLLLARVRALILYDRGDCAASAELLEATLPTCRRVHGEDHPETLIIEALFATVLCDLDRLAEAESLASAALEKHRQSMGNLHPESLRLMGVLGSVYQAQGRFDDAAALLAEFESVARRELPSEH